MAALNVKVNSNVYAMLTITVSLGYNIVPVIGVYLCVNCQTALNA